MKGAEPRRELCTFTTYLHPLRLIQAPRLWSVYAFVLGQIQVCVCVRAWKSLACERCHHLHTSQRCTHADSRAPPSAPTQMGKLNGKMFLSGTDVCLPSNWEAWESPDPFLFWQWTISNGNANAHFIRLHFSSWQMWEECCSSTNNMTLQKSRFILLPEWLQSACFVLQRIIRGSNQPHCFSRV